MDTNSVGSQSTLLFKHNYYTYSGPTIKQLNALVLLRQYNVIPLLYVHNAVFKPFQICLMTQIVYTHINLPLLLQLNAHLLDTYKHNNAYQCFYLFNTWKVCKH